MSTNLNVPPRGRTAADPSLIYDGGELKRPSALVILGPTTVGKTDVAFRLARILDAEVCNADKFYLYDSLGEVTGRSDAEQYPGVPTHLYQVLEPFAPRWSEMRYRAELAGCLRAIHARRKLPIVEGCSGAFVQAALRELESFAEPPLVIGLRWKSGFDLAGACERRIDGMYRAGMTDRFNRALVDGMGETFLARKCFAREQLLAYRTGHLNQTEFRTGAAERLERHALRHVEILARNPNVHWLEHDSSEPKITLSRILVLLAACRAEPA